MGQDEAEFGMREAVVQAVVDVGRAGVGIAAEFAAHGLDMFRRRERGIEVDVESVAQGGGQV